MRPRHAVHITSSKSSHHIQLLSRQHFVRVSPLAATFMVSPASVANKRLAVRISSLDATLTKIRGREGSPTFQQGCLSKLALTLSPLSPFFSYSCALSCTTALAQLFSSQLVTHSFHRDGGCTPLTASWISTLDANCHTARPALFSSILRYLSARFARLLLHCSPHGTPTPRPTFPRRSSLARRDRARHPRLAAFHRSAPAGRSTLLDRNWFGAR